MNNSFDIIQMVKTLRRRKHGLEEAVETNQEPQLGRSSQELEVELRALQERHAVLQSQVSDDPATNGSEGLLVAKLVATAERLIGEMSELRGQLSTRHPELAANLALYNSYEAELLKVARLEVELSKGASSSSETLTKAPSRHPATEGAKDNPCLAPGHLLRGRYKVAKVLGKGGTGAVYGVTDQRTPQVWALKELWSDNPTFNIEQIRHQLTAEVQVLSQLRHPNLPRVVDAFEENARHYIVMDFVEGQTLAQVLTTHKKLPVKHALEVGVKLASVLSYLHAQDNPIIFRDLKPANIMVREDGDVRLVDFGIARYFAKGASNDTQALGTPGYAAPEQYGGGQSDQRSDVYALGANLHQMITGINPGLSPFRFDPIRKHCPEISAEFEAVIARCLELDQVRRPQNVGEVQTALLDEIRRRNGGVLPEEMAVFGDAGAVAAEQDSGSLLDSEDLNRPVSVEMPAVAAKIEEPVETPVEAPIQAPVDSPVEEVTEEVVEAGPAQATEQAQPARSAFPLVATVAALILVLITIVLLAQ